jgi:hypothetical protein
MVVDQSVCSSSGSLQAPTTLEQCEAVQCDGLFWREASEWSACSAPCTRRGDGVDAVLGVSTRVPPTCMRVEPNGTQTEAAVALCMSKLGVGHRSTVARVEVSVLCSRVLEVGPLPML